MNTQFQTALKECGTRLVVMERSTITVFPLDGAPEWSIFKARSPANTSLSPGLVKIA